MWGCRYVFKFMISFPLDIHPELDPWISLPFQPVPKENFGITSRGATGKFLVSTGICQKFLGLKVSSQWEMRKARLEKEIFNRNNLLYILYLWVLFGSSSRLCSHIILNSAQQNKSEQGSRDELFVEVMSNQEDYKVKSKCDWKKTKNPPQKNK